MPTKIVLGAQWGDEGKAKVVDYLTLEADVVVRYQGGPTPAIPLSWGTPNSSST